MPSPRRQFTRRTLLAGGLAAGLGALDAFALEPRWLEVTEHAVPIAGLPSALEGFRIAQLTDVHLHELTTLHERIVQELRRRRPNLVVLTGDIVDSERHFGLLEALCSELRTTGATVLATLGNWEHWGGVDSARLAKSYARTESRLLGNESLTLEAGPTVIATDDSCSGNDDLAEAARQAPTDGPRLLLTHAPGLLDRAALPRFDLALAGHTHGGQVRLGTFAPFLPPGSGSFESGSYTRGDARVYVSRGIGSSIVPVRLMCRPELPVFTLERA